MMTKRQIRAAFRATVFERDNYCCVMCGKKADPKEPEKLLDSHHIIDRSEMVEGGYCKENGISLCKECHKKAEKWHASGHKEFVAGYKQEDLFAKIGSSPEKAIAASNVLANFIKNLREISDSY